MRILSAPCLTAFVLSALLPGTAWASAPAPLSVFEEPSQQQAPEKKAQEKKDPKKSDQAQQSARQPKPKPSLVELAQRTREERQKTEKPVLIYTNSVIKQTQGGLVGKTQAPPPPPSEGEEAEGQAEDEAAEGEQDPEAELRQLRSDLQAARLDYVTAVNQHQVLQLSINETRNRYLRESNVAAQQKWQSDLAQQAQELSQLERTIQSARAKIDELSRQASQAGMQPGELRDLVGQLPEPKRIVNQ